MQMNGFFNTKRLIFIGTVVVLFACVILFKFGKLAFTKTSKSVSSKPVVERGQIVDRNGKPLAVQSNFYHLGISPKNISDEKISMFTQELGKILETAPEEIEAKIKANRNSEYVLIKKKITQQQYDEVRKFAEEKKFTGIKGDRLPGRVYPENNLASQLIGYMGDDGEGLSGIELSQNRLLSPSVDPNNPVSVHGKNIYLTIDANLQYKLEKIAKKAMDDTNAEGIMLLASQAKTGEILSYISLPDTNLNEYPSSTPDQKRDRISLEIYEPGSVFKIFTTASFLDAETISPESSFLCDGIHSRRGDTGDRIMPPITCLGKHGWLNTRTALKYSCNDALAQMSDTITSEAFLDYLHAFGFGSSTGIEILNETKGILHSPQDRNWSARSKPAMAIGQEVSVSAIQMLQAATTIADMGIPLQLTTIKKITDKDGNVEYEHKRTEKPRVIREATAKHILSCMETTALSGTGAKANLGDISIGVKTGTAQMGDKSGNISKTDFTSNCMAVFPIENPEIVLYIVIQKPKGETYAGRIVAPVIHEAADEIIDHLGMSRDKAASLEHSGRTSVKENAPLVLGDKVPDFMGRPKRDIMPLLGKEGISFSIQGEGWVVSQNPPAGTPVTENMVIELKFE